MSRRIRSLPAPRQWLVIIGLLAVAAATYWLPHRQFGPAQPQIHPPQHADYYARDARMVITGADGRPLYRIHSKEALHYPNQWSTLHQVRVTYLGRKQPPWHTRADMARIPPGQQQIHMYGHVVSNGRLKTGAMVTMTSPRMTVLLNSKRLRTDAPVDVVSGTRRTTGVGMRAQLNKQQVEFLHDVHSTYQP